jgi:ATP-dependent exoDNAse (exonuclease V) alpha subunit
MRAESANSLIASIYPAIDTTPPPPPEYFLNRMILAPRNIDVGDINQEILDRMAGDSRRYISADEIIRETGADPRDDEPIPIEYLRSINSSSLPPGDLNLKIGCPVILLRNLSPGQGLCNGTRMVITQMGNRVLEVRLLGGERDGQTALIPRISLTPTSSPETSFRFKRRQFPVRLAFALSINKSQGQSVQHVGLYLRLPVFAHGQLYVALSRATSPHNIKILLPDDAEESVTTNVVYDEVLID